LAGFKRTNGSQNVQAGSPGCSTAGHLIATEQETLDFLAPIHEFDLFQQKVGFRTPVHFGNTNRRKSRK
jgi:hypothetical protein